jgi:cation/acetate symporter
MGNNIISIGFFFAFMALTLVITYWAARRTRTTEHFFAAGGEVTPWQNGWAQARCSESRGSSPRTASTG